MFCPCGFPNPQGSNCGSATSVPVDLQSTGELIAGLRPARIKNPQLLTRGLNPRGQRKPTTSQHGDFSVPVDLQSTGELIAGLQPARIKNPQLLTWGLQIPEDKRDSRGHCDMVNLQIDHGEL